MCLMESRRMLRNKDSDVDLRKNDSGYQTPSRLELERLLWAKDGLQNHVDLVWTNLYLGDEWTARNKVLLRELGISHILNVAHGRFNVNTGPGFYRDLHIMYYGIEAYDEPNFDLGSFFDQGAHFIKQGLDTPGGRVLVHCGMGISRASSLVLAYLMIYEKLTLVDAIKAVSSHRNICPNNGFLCQLIQLDKCLHQKRTTRSLLATFHE
ncbi:dual specificity protein phosphatase 13B-like [Discoglossus pictus]